MKQTLEGAVYDELQQVIKVLEEYGLDFETENMTLQEAILKGIELNGWMDAQPKSTVFCLGIFLGSKLAFEWVSARIDREEEVAAS